jgi:LuxR family maltose regulon positive regulatory protein
MTTPLLQTKLYLPPAGPNLVSRPRLVERLDEGIHTTRLTLISAPAGYGKTTLVSEWVSDAKHPAAWLSLDKGDNDLVGFLTYLVAALQTINSGIGEDLLSVLQSPQAPSLELLLTLLINDLAAVPFEDNLEGGHRGSPYVLVLDDYHVIKTPSVHRSLEFLLENLPPQLRLVILTREDPPLPLPRLLVQRQLTNIRAQDLRFTIDELTQFFQYTMGLHLTAQDAARLENRTEGWIAGLQMAALTLQNEEDTSTFVQTFTGDDRYVVDYLVSEVLRRQPLHIRTFLLLTSVLQRFNASLCNAMLAGEAGPHSEPQDGREILAQLERANLFLTPLDRQREWYRYHQLFADLLRYQLRAQEGDTRILDLHRRAARWFERHDLADDALFHYLAAGDTTAAATLVAAHAVQAFRRGEFHSVEKWLEALPEQSILASPRLCLDAAWICAVRDDYEPLVRFVSAAEAALPGSIYENDPDFLGEWSALQAFSAFLLGDAQAALTLGLQALDQLAPQSAFVRGVINILLVDIYTSTDIGEVSQAVACGRQALETSLSSANTTIALYAADRLARALVLQGEYRAAEAVFLQAFEMLRARGMTYAPILEILDLKLAGVLYELNSLSEAEGLIRDGLSLSQKFEAPYSELWCRLLLRQVQLAQQKPVNALDPLASDEAIDALLLELSSQHKTPPAMDQFEAYRAQLWTDQTQLRRAEEWAENAGLSLKDNPSTGKISSYLALAYTYLASGKLLPELITLLEKMRQLASRKGHVQHEVQIGLLRTLSLDKLDRFQDARSTLEACLALAEPTGMTRTFLDHGAPLINLLRQAEHPYATRLLAAIEPGKTAAALSTPSEPAETLSEREIEVLRLFAAGMTNAAVAKRLFVSQNTVKWYAKNIYRKLDVHSRAEALARAYEMDLLS